MPEFCLVDKADHITTVTINRPERLNALHPAGNVELGEVFDEFAADDDQWVAIITGAGRGFSEVTTSGGRPRAALACRRRAASVA